MADPVIMKSFLTLCGLGATTAGAWGFLVEPRIVKQRHLRLESPRWPDHVPELRIAVLGDFQVGAPWFKVKQLDKVVARVNAMEPDLVVLLGDYVIEGVLFGRFVHPPDIARSLGNLKARYGVYSVLGNHDWWHDGDEIRRELEAVGIHVLENESASIQLPEGRIWVAGLADESTREPCMIKTFSTIPDDEPVIALAHDPMTFFDIPERAVVTFAGHTHGGQFRLPIVGTPYSVGGTPRRLAYGLVEEEGRHIYVTSGLGTSAVPMRFNMPPEIAMVTLAAT
jgi:predicted MPP superfamily phosphohydrolase